METPYIIGSVKLSPENGLERERIVNSKIIIDCVSRMITVEGFDYTYAPDGTIISQVPFRYERDNIAEIKEVIGKPAVEQVKDTEGNIIVDSEAEVSAVAYVAANPRFNNYTVSPIGKGISAMVQHTLDTML